ncbi:MAG: MBL fold metallo-hydrolase [Treponemataceae bacterium]|nr:MBL fold metallo-hydrolase [Treponemataceae bacterium]
MHIQALKDKLSLTNDGALSLFFLGTGSAFTKTNFQTNLLVIKGKDHILIDCGTLCSRAFAKCGLSIKNIDNFHVTHSHADHIGGLEEVAFLNRYGDNKTLSMYITPEYRDVLWENSLKGGLAYGEESDGPSLTFADYFTIKELKPIENSPRPFYETYCGSINLKIFRTKHVPNKHGDWSTTFHSTGVVIDDKIIFTGDTIFDRDLIDWLDSIYPSSPAIFHDCQFYKGGVHASYEELLSLPENIRKKMYLCHYGDNRKGFHPKKDGFAGFARHGVYYVFD